MIEHVIGKHELKSKLLQKYKEEKRICEALVEITDVCNFKCEYCYLQGKKKEYLSFDTFERIVDALKANGCLYLTISGGEPLIHPDFVKFYLASKERFPFVSVFTNGSLIDEKLIDLWREYPPYELEISMYGTTEDEYNKFVRCEGAYDKVCTVIDALGVAGINYSLKTTVTSFTKDLEAYQNFAKIRGVSFRYDTWVGAGCDGEQKPINFRLSSDKCIDYYRMEKEYLASLEARVISKEDNERLFLCDAGVNSVFVDSQGKVSMCVFERSTAYEITDQMSLMDIQRKLMGHRDEVLQKAAPCRGCDKKKYCRYCPGRFQLEGRSTLNPPVWYCETAKKLSVLCSTE